MKRQILIQAGDVYGNLTIIDVLKGQAKTMCVGECSCGIIKTYTAANLYSGSTRSCGCLRGQHISDAKYQHGKQPAQMYASWRSMRSRCYVTKDASYHRYGALGIVVCHAWKESFTPFKAWALANGWAEGKTIDRISNTGNYEPSNCRWATPKEQARNRTNNVLISFQGQMLPIAAVNEMLGMKRGTLGNRLMVKHWPLERALSTPVRGSKGGLCVL